MSILRLLTSMGSSQKTIPCSLCSIVKSGTADNASLVKLSISGIHCFYLYFGIVRISMCLTSMVSFLLTIVTG
jgi:hypothetical protein